MRCKLKDLGFVSTGNTPSKSNEAFYDSDDIGFVKPDILSDCSITESIMVSEYISENARSKARIVKDGAVFVTCIGSIGKVGVADGEYAFNQQINAIQPNEKVSSKYLAYCMLFNKKALQAIANAPVVPIINKSQFEEFELEIEEDTNEQKRIVEILDKVNGVLESRKRELQELDNLIKSRFVEMFGDPRSNPHGFSKKMLKDTCKVVTGNTPSRSVEEYYGDYVEWIKTDNIVSGLLNPTKATESLSEEGMKVGRTVEKDSILMACIAGSISSIGRVCVTDRTVAFNQQINAVVPEEYNILFLYVLLQLSKEYLVEEINMALKGILSKSKLEEKMFIVPPMELQEQFSDFVHQVDKLKVELQKTMDETQILFDSLMQKYFG